MLIQVNEDGVLNVLFWQFNSCTKILSGLHVMEQRSETNATMLISIRMDSHALLYTDYRELVVVFRLSIHATCLPGTSKRGRL